jgi:peptidoglycan hydrolase CwlO-like protein
MNNKDLNNELRDLDAKLNAINSLLENQKKDNENLRNEIVK